jgi:hypothetical protein
MREIAVEYRMAHWAEITRDRSARGMSIREYCRVTGIRENVYFYWQRKLRKAAYESISEQSSAGKTELVPTSFAEIRVAEATGQLALPSAPPPSQISIVSGGVRITTDSTYPPELLAVLVRELWK